MALRTEQIALLIRYPSIFVVPGCLYFTSYLPVYEVTGNAISQRVMSVFWDL